MTDVTRTYAIAPSLLELDELCQARELVNTDVVDDYAEAYKEGVPLPPPDVYEVVGVLHVVDGWHRVLAALKVGLEALEVRIVGEGSMAEAQWHASGANLAHGLRRTWADKRRAVRLALDSPIGQEQSSRTIAKHCGVSHTFVTKMRQEWESDRAVPETEPEAPQVTEDFSEGVGSEADGVATLPPASDRAPEPDCQEASGDPLYTAKMDAADMEEVLRSSRRAVEQVAKGDGLMAQCAAGVSQDLLALARQVKQWVPVECPACGGDGCQACGQQGWTRKMSARGTK